jgi:hypothetical protein
MTWKSIPTKVQEIWFRDPCIPRLMWISGGGHRHQYNTPSSQGSGRQSLKPVFKRLF